MPEATATDEDGSTRGRIPAATAEVLGANGMTKLSLSQVAQQAGVSRPTRSPTFFGGSLAHPAAAPLVAAALGDVAPAGGPVLGTDLLRMIESIPVDRLIALSAGGFGRTQLEDLIARVNSARSPHPAPRD